MIILFETLIRYIIIYAIQEQNLCENASWNLSIRILVLTKKQLFDLNLAIDFIEKTGMSRLNHIW